MSSKEGLLLKNVLTHKPPTRHMATRCSFKANKCEIEISEITEGSGMEEGFDSYLDTKKRVINRSKKYSKKNTKKY